MENCWLGDSYIESESVGHSLCDPMDTRLLCPWDFPGKNTGLGYHFFLQGIFQTQGSVLSLLHFRQILYCQSQWFFKIFSILVYFMYLAVCDLQSSLWHVGSSSLTRDPTQAPCFGSTESQPLDHQRSPWNTFEMSCFIHKEVLCILHLFHKVIKCKLSVYFLSSYFLCNIFYFLFKCCHIVRE